MLAALCYAMPLMGNPPEWTINPPDYAHTASIIAQLEVNSVPDHNMNNIIGFFVGNEVRAIGTPISYNGGALYFITVYSNILQGEEMAIKIYVADDDFTYTSHETYIFQKSDIVGSLENPDIIELFSDGDFPIFMDEIPEQITLQTMAFITIDLNDYLQQEDSDFVNWAYQVNPDLQVQLNGSLLDVMATDDDFLGSLVLNLTATELTSNQYSANFSIIFTVKEFFISPTWEALPDHTVMQGEIFPAINLNDYEYTYDGNCLEFSVQPALEIPDPWFPRPTWEDDVVDPELYQYTMTTIHQVQFSDYYRFDGDNDLLAAFVNGECRGVAKPVRLRGQTYFFLNTYSNEPGQMELRYFSEQYRNIYPAPEPLDFEPHFSNPFVEPIHIDVAPIKVEVLPFGGAIIYVCDEEWIGSQMFQFTVEDCNNPDFSDVTFATFTVEPMELPIELIDFQATLTAKQEVILNWEIVPSPDLEVFEIERVVAQNGSMLWETLGKIESPQSTVSHFSFTDALPKEGLNYYRLKMVEHSGEYNHSRTVAINLNKSENADISIYPNPVIAQEVSIEIPTFNNDTALIEIFDTKGQLAFQQSLTQLNHTIQLPPLPNGVYWINIQTKENTWMEKLVIQ